MEYRTMNSSLLVLVFAILWMLMGWFVCPVGLLSFSDNSCETIASDGSVVYKTCLSEPLFVLSPGVSLNTLTVTPTTATCGIGSSQLSCTLGIYQTCIYCDSTDPTKSHPPQYMDDYNSTINSVNLNTYWQSVTWDQAKGVPQANITMSFGRLYQMWDDMVITFASIRPQQLLLEKSMDNGVTWTTLQYFNISCTALVTSGIKASFDQSSPDAVICSQDFSGEYPSVGGQVVFSVLGRFNLFLGSNTLDYSNLYNGFATTNLMNFLSFTDLRIQLLYPATDGKEAFGETKDLVRYYYAISDIRITAGCWCNLHAKYCAINGTRMSCICKHNTDGDSCERCLPLFNNRPWAVGKYLPYPDGTPNECQACTCYKHADSCIYDPTIGYGRCNFCRDNTTGPQCNQCLPGFFQDPTRNLSDPNICQTCSCQPLGVSNGDMTCAPSTGQCNCKALVMGRQCDVCFDQFYGLLLFAGVCTPCACNTVGTVGQSNVCDKQTGQCPCKPNIFSRDCSLCRDGFYEFPAFFISQDCLDCACDDGGALSPVCVKQGGQCTCRPNIIGRRCIQSANGYYVPLIEANNVKPQPATCKASTDLVRFDKPFTERTFVFCNQSQTTTFDLLSKLRQPRIMGSYIPALRYGLSGSLQWTSLTLVIRPSGTNYSVNLTKYAGDPLAASPPTCSQFLPITFTLQNLTAGYGNAWMANNATSFQLDARCIYTTTLTANTPGGAVQPLLVDSLVLVPDYRRSTVYANETNPIVQAQYDNCVRSMLPLQTRDATKIDPVCRPFMFSVMAEQSQGALPCDCDPTGSVPGTVCDAVGGQCLCQPGVSGRRCQYCQQGYYNFTINGCTPCNCDASGSSNPVCDYVTGQCPCQPNVALAGQLVTTGQPSDLQCHYCIANFYGVTTGLGCQACSCSTLGSTSPQCDELGICQCLPTIGGNKCNTCLPGYYGFSFQGCKQCNCSVFGAQNITCDNLSGNCYCKANVKGTKCDTCVAGTFNIATFNPDGCQPCFCWGHATQCTNASGYSEYIISDDSSTWEPALDHITYIAASSMFLGNKLRSYGQWLSYNAQTRPGIVVNMTSDSQPVILEGNGTSIAYRPINVTVTEVMSQIIFPLHQSYWYYTASGAPLDAKTFYAILGSLSRILIQQRFVYDFIKLTIVSMRSAMKSPDGSSQISFVENCTCNPGQNVAGLSCGNCSQGYQRPSNTSNLFSNCIQCNCNSRSNKTNNQPTCDEWTGNCLNCIYGASGLHCEICAPSVDQVTCGLCSNTYWNLTKDGCQRCNCLIQFTNFLTPVCNKTSGQCSCDPVFHRGGLTCERCADNYVNTTTGCQPCNSCYGLVFAQMQLLQANQSNLGGLVGQLLSQDNSSTAGPFYVRLTNAQNNISALNVFSSNALALEPTLPAQLQALQAALQQLVIALTTSVAPMMNTVSQNIKTARDNLLAATLAMNSTATSLTQAYNQLFNEMPGFTTQLQNLLNSLTSVLNAISGSSSAVISGVNRLTQTVVSIEYNAYNASIASQTALALMQTCQGLINQLMGRLLPGLDTMTKALNVTGQQINIMAQSTMNRAEILLTNASNLRDQINSISLTPYDLATASAIIQQQLATAAQLANASVTAQSSSQPTFSQVQTSNILTTQLINQVNGNSTALNILNNRFQAANQTAANAVSQAQNATDQAQRMLNIISNFDASAQAVQNQANQALQTVQNIRNMSQQATNFSNQLLQSLQTAISTSTQAQQLAAQALAAVNRLSQPLGPVSDKANLLLTQSSSVLNDIQAKAADVLNKNITIVTVLANSLNGYLATVQALEARAQLAKASADNVTAQVLAMRNTINGLNLRLQAIQGLDPIAVNQLQSDVQQAYNYYNSLALATTVTSLNQTITGQRVWINDMMKRRDDLQQQITRLQILLAELSA